MTDRYARHLGFLDELLQLSREQRTPRSHRAFVTRAIDRLDHELKRALADEEHRRALGHPEPRHEPECGEDSAYYRHLRKGIPFPEDEGEAPCGCRRAHASAAQRRKLRAREDAVGRQLTIYDAFDEAAS